MSTQDIHILFIADIVGLEGVQLVSSHLPKLINTHRLDLVIANGENAKKGRGLDDKTSKKLFDLGIQVITSGNHIWQRQSYLTMIHSHPNLLRPLNYPPDCPGHGSCIVEVSQNVKVGIINLQGRSFMYPIDCPFRSAEQEILQLRKRGARIIIIDFHAEATAEKMALGWFLDSRVSAVLGTHTHVQTADERILPGGTAYITESGMTGSFNSVIGMDKHAAIKRFITQLPVPYKIAQGDTKFCGVLLTIDQQSTKAKSIERVQIVD